MLRARYDAACGGSPNTFSVTRHLGRALELTCYLRSTDVSDVHVVTLLVKRYERGDIRLRVEGQIVRLMTRIDSSTFQVEACDLNPYSDWKRTSLPFAALFLTNVPEGVLDPPQPTP